MMKRLLIAGFTFVLATSFAWASGHGSRIDTLVIALGTPSQETNRAWLVPIFEHIQMEPYLESLLDNNPETGETIPSLAESWETNDDRSEWTFSLREGVQFHHGWGEFTSADVIHSHTLWSDPESPMANQSLWARTEVTADGPYQVTFQFPEPQFFGEDLFNRFQTEGFIWSKAQWDEQGVGGIDRLPAGTGSYMYTERADGQYLRFKANPDHWSGVTPDFPNIEFRYIPEESTRYATLVTGAAHIADLPRELFPDALSEGMILLESPVPNYQSHLVFGGSHFSETTPDPDMSVPWLADQRVRRALNHAINRDEIIEFVYEGLAQPVTNSGFQELLEGWNPQWESDFDEYYGYNPELAIQLIEEAGYSVSDIRPVFVAPRFPGSEEFPTLIEAIQQQLASIGINAEIREMDTATLRSQSVDFRTSGMIIPLRNLPVRRSVVFASTVLGTGTPWKTYETDEIDDLANRWRATFDPEEREELARTVGDIVFYQHAVMPIAELARTFVADPNAVEGWTFPGVTSAGMTHFELIEAVQ